MRPFGMIVKLSLISYIQYLTNISVYYNDPAWFGGIILQILLVGEFSGQVNQFSASAEIETQQLCYWRFEKANRDAKNVEMLSDKIAHLPS